MVSKYDGLTGWEPHTKPVTGLISISYCHLSKNCTLLLEQIVLWLPVAHTNYFVKIFSTSRADEMQVPVMTDLYIC